MGKTVVRSIHEPISKPVTQEGQLPDIPLEFKKKSNKWLILVLFLLFLSALGVAGYFTFQNYQFETKPSSIPISFPPSPTTISIDNWLLYSNSLGKFSFRYPEKNYKINNYSLVEYGQKLGNPDLVNAFTDMMGYSPPEVIIGTVLEDSSSTSFNPILENYFSLWVLSNNEGLNPDDWYEKYQYFGCGPFTQKLSEERKPINTVSIDGTEGKMMVYKDQVDQKLILVPKFGNMYCFHLSPTAQIDNQILQSFTFIK